MKYRVWRIRGDGNITATNGTLSPGVAFQIEEIRLHLSADGGDNDLVLTVDSDAHASAHDTVILSQNTNGVTDYVYQPTRPHVFEAGDDAVFTWTNANSHDYGLEVYYSAI